MGKGPARWMQQKRAYQARERTYTTQQRMALPGQKTPAPDTLDALAELVMAGGRTGERIDTMTDGTGRKYPVIRAARLIDVPGAAPLKTVTGPWQAGQCGHCHQSLAVNGTCQCQPGECDGTPLGVIAARTGRTPGQVAAILTAGRRQAVRHAPPRPAAPRRTPGKRTTLSARNTASRKDHGLWNG